MKRWAPPLSVVIALVVVTACGSPPGDIGERPPTGTIVASRPTTPMPGVAIDCPECVLIETHAVARARGPAPSSTPSSCPNPA